MLSRSFSIAISLIAGSLPQAGLAQIVTVFTASHIPIQNSSQEVSFVQLDTSLLIEKQMSLNLPSNPQEAEHLIRTRMQSQEWRQLEQDLQRSSEAVAKAHALGIDKLPAVVVDDRYVVYGISDVAQALEMIRAQGGTHDAD